MNQETIETLANLKSQSGGTSLITYYLSGNTNLWLAVEKLNNELSTASNIKNKTVRKDVEQALRQSIYQLKNCGLNKTPTNGYVLCAGTVVENKCCL